MDFSRIKDQSRAVLEQGCERYATMAYETMNDRLAIGLKSTTYSYDNYPEKAGVGVFCAKFIPFNQNHLVLNWRKVREVTVSVKWHIVALTDGRWQLTDGELDTIEQDLGYRTIHWSTNGRGMKLIRHHNDEKYSVGCDESQTFDSLVQI